MIVAGRRILICTCEDSMTIDGPGLAAALGATPEEAGEPPQIHRHLCRSELAAFQQALDDGVPVLAACAQEAALFQELAADSGAPAPLCVDLRDRAGWTADSRPATAKMAALLADALTPTTAPDSLTLTSHGQIIVLGEDDAALTAAARLGRERPVICLLTAVAADMTPPFVRPFAVLSGRLAAAAGHLGDFSLTVENPAGLAASARDCLRFDPPGPPQTLMADIVLDLRRAAPPLWGERDGYLRCDPAHPAALAAALGRALALQGDHAKPRYVHVETQNCVHARARLVACTRCIDVCPAGAIVPDGDAVRVDPAICVGHGACAAACPTGALRFDLPVGNGIFHRLRGLLQAYARGGGTEAVVLLYETGHGDDMLAALARFGAGSPAHILPFPVAAVAAAGLDFLLTAAAYGAARVILLADPQRHADLAAALDAAQTANAALAGLGWGVRVDLLCTSDPDALATALAAPLAGPYPAAAGYLALGDKRATLTQALTHLRRGAPRAAMEIPLPAGAPFGGVCVDEDRCTLCLSCVGVCPTGALSHAADPPSLGFTETACVQCGLCRVACPERAVALTPRLNLRVEARNRQVVKQDEPHACPACGKVFATRSAIALLTARLADHPLFAGTGRLGLLQLCEDCRGEAQQGGAMTPNC